MVRCTSPHTTTFHPLRPAWRKSTRALRWRRHAAIATTKWNSIRSSSVTPRINHAVCRAQIERLGLGRCCEAELWFKRTIAVPESASPLATGPATRFPTFGAIEECVRGPGTPRPHPFKLEIEIARPNHQLARAKRRLPCRSARACADGST